MTASVRSAGTVFQTNGTATTNFVLQIPGDIEVGDLMIAIIVVDDTGGALDLNIVPGPSGWNPTSNVMDSGPTSNDYILDGNTHDMQVWSKIYGSNDGTSATFTDASNSHHCAGVIIAIKDPGAIDIFGISENGSSATPTCPDVTTGETSLILWIYGGNKATNGATPSDYPAGTTGLVHSTSGGGVNADDVLIGVAYEVQSSAGATGTAAFSISASEGWHSMTIAIDLETLWPVTETESSTDIRKTIVYPYFRRRPRIG
jgi:hypothetical protein